MPELVRVQTVMLLDAWRVQVLFTNGEQRVIDLLPYLGDGPIFAPIRSDYTFFQTVHVAGGTLAWPNGADIDPDVLYYGGSPPWTQSLSSTTQQV
ncbi:MAG: DUF2442 domain-containing protein [Oscillochloridaceae bacterium umkhey_bin13]